MIGYPNNPTGAVASRETLLEVLRIAEEHDLVVISDEIYDRLVYGPPHVCFAALPGARERTITLGGFSKDYAMTGWRIGYAAAPAETLAGLAAYPPIYDHVCTHHGTGSGSGGAAARRIRMSRR